MDEIRIIDERGDLRFSLAYVVKKGLVAIADGGALFDRV